MIEVALVLVIGALAAIGLASGRWSAVLAPFFVVPGFYFGLGREWWGYGLGDGWQYAMFAVLATSVAVTATAVALRHGLKRARR